MQETIASAVWEGLKRVDVVTDEDRRLFQEAYGAPVEEFTIDDQWDDELEDYVAGEVPPLGFDYGGTNDDLASVITQALLVEGEVEQKDGRKVFAAVKEALDSYPTMVVAGREQNVYYGSPEDFAEETAEKIEAALEKRGVLGKVAKLLKLR